MEDRTVPSLTETVNLTFQNGDTGTATFTMPVDAIDPGDASQSIALDDLEVDLDGETFTAGEFAGTPTADFANGDFLGVTFALDLPGETVDFPYTSVAVADGSGLAIRTTDWESQGAITATCDPLSGTGTFSFSLPGGEAVDGTFAFPPGSLDPNQVEQHVPLSDLSLTIGGQPFSLTDTVAGATAVIYNDAITPGFGGLNFAIGQPALGPLPYDGVRVTGMTAAVLPPANVPIAAVQTAASVTVNFSPITIPAAGQSYVMDVRVTVTGPGGDTQFTASVEVNAGATADIVRDGVKTALEGVGVIAIPNATSSTVLTVKGTANGQLKKLEFLPQTATFTGPEKVLRTKGPTGGFPVYSNGTTSP